MAKQKTKAEKKRQVIKWLNDTFKLAPRIRSLEKGVPMQADQDPIANTLRLQGLSVEVHPVMLVLKKRGRGGGTTYIEPPQFIMDFCLEFDDGQYPELEISDE